MENVTSEKVKQLKSEGKKILVDYWAKWCGPCKSLIPRLETIESQYPDVTFVKVDVDENMDSALDLGIRSVPTIIIYNGEKLISRSQGANSESFYKDILNNL
jgi:thioredoxin